MRTSVQRDLDVRTGESIEIRYELAGLGSRFLAVALDIAIQIGVTLVCVLMLFLLVGPLHAGTAHAPLSRTGAKTAQAVAGALATFGIFVLYFGYFIVFELWWSGRTPGKRALGLRVVRDAGFPIDIGAAVVRNVVRVIEVALGLYAVSAVCALLSPRNKRLGDLAAGTVVVRDCRHAAADIEAYLGREARQDDGLDTVEGDLIARYLARRSALEPAARARLATAIATRVRPKLRATFGHLDDDALLEHLGSSR